MRSSPGPARTLFDTPLKWAGVVTALVALLFGLNQASKAFGDIRDRKRQVGELQALADRQQRAGDFADAWASLERAAAVAGDRSYFADLTGDPGTERQAVGTAQENLAMAWLERTVPPGTDTFDGIAEPVVPMLNAAAAAAAGRRRADLLAHTGWAAARAANSAANPDAVSLYRQALDADASNPYAHAYWGHWLAEHQSLDQAIPRFDAALASGRARAHVRLVQLAALRRRDRPAYDVAYLSAVADMVRNEEPVDAAARKWVDGLYERAFDDDARFDALAAAVPPTAQIAVIHALFFDVDFDPARTPLRDACLARLHETAGDAPAALAMWRSILAALPPTATGPVAARARAAVAAAASPLLR